MNIETMSQQELESLAYNLLIEAKKIQNNLAIVENQILKLKNAPKESVKENAPSKRK